MEQLELKPRSTGLDTKPHQLRRKGVLPLAIVSSDKPPILAQMDRVAFESAMGHNDGVAKFMAKLEGESKAFEVLVKEVQKTPLDRRPIHAVLQRVKDSDVVKVQVQIVTTGEPVGVNKGRSNITQYTDTVELKGELGHIPESIVVDVSGMEDDDKILISGLQLPAGVESLTSADATVVLTQTIKVKALEETPEAESAGSEGGEAADSGDSN